MNTVPVSPPLAERVLFPVNEMNDHHYFVSWCWQYAVDSKTARGGASYGDLRTLLDD